MQNKSVMWLIGEIQRLEITVFNLQQKNENLEAEIKIIQKGDEDNESTKQSKSKHR